MTAHQLTLLAVIGIAACWGALALAWLLGAIYYESRAPAERKRSWFGTAVWPGLAITFAVTFVVPRADWNSVILHPAWARILGLAILVAATAFAIWARIALGAIWSAAPTVLEEHKLRTSGPYSVTRHPIYTGLLAMLAGTTLLAGGGRWIVAFPVSLVLVEIKLHIEERLMLAEFPDDYPRYRKRVPQLVPGLRLGRHSLPKLFLNGINGILTRPESRIIITVAHSIQVRRFPICLSSYILYGLGFMALVAGLGQMNADARQSSDPLARSALHRARARGSRGGRHRRPEYRLGRQPGQPDRGR